MVCVYCGAETRVTNSRSQKRNNQVWRRRLCQACGAVFTTHEAVDLSSSLLVDSSGSMRPFLPDLLYTEVLLALQDRKNCYVDAREVTSTVIKKLLAHPNKPVYQPGQISRAAAEVLEKLDRRAWMRYAAEHPSVHQ